MKFISNFEFLKFKLLLLKSSPIDPDILDEVSLECDDEVALPKYKAAPYVIWDSLRTLPELDTHNHAELGIVEKGFIAHYYDIKTNLIYEVDEYELFEMNDVRKSKIIGIYDIKNDKILIDKNKMRGLTELDLPKIKELFGLV